MSRDLRWGQGRSNLNLSKCQNLFKMMKLRVNLLHQISRLRIYTSQASLVIEVSQDDNTFFKAMGCDKVFWLRCDSPGSDVVTFSEENSQVTGRRVTGNISG